MIFVVTCLCDVLLLNIIVKLYVEYYCFVNLTPSA